MEWNERIAAARKAAGLTQEALGEKLGVSRQAVSKWESGQAVPDLDTVAKLCLALGFSADYLLFGRETAPAESAPAEPAPGPVYPDTCPCCGRPPPRGPRCPPRGGRLDPRQHRREHIKSIDFVSNRANGCRNSVE